MLHFLKPPSSSTSTPPRDLEAPAPHTYPPPSHRLTEIRSEHG
jgi:hypothetical protein